MLSPFPRCRHRVLLKLSAVGDGFRAVGARGGLAVDASGGTEIAAGAGGGAEEAAFFALSLVSSLLGHFLLRTTGNSDFSQNCRFQM
jgi:hypothetical protein